MATFVRPKSTSYLLPNSPSLSTAASITRSCLSHGTVLNPNFFSANQDLQHTNGRRKRSKAVGKRGYSPTFVSNFCVKACVSTIVPHFVRKSLQFFFQLLIQHSKLPLTQVALRVVTPTYYALSEPTSQIIFLAPRQLTQNCYYIFTVPVPFQQHLRQYFWFQDD